MKKFLLSPLGIGIILALAGSITNPLTGSWIMVGIENGFQYMFRHGAWISLAAGAYWIIFGSVLYLKSSRLNIPSKTAKTKKAGEFIEI